MIVNSGYWSDTVEGLKNQQRINVTGFQDLVAAARQAGGRPDDRWLVRLDTFARVLGKAMASIEQIPSIPDVKPIVMGDHPFSKSEQQTKRESHA